jgi:hypothetical protein
LPPFINGGPFCQFLCLLTVDTIWYGPMGGAVKWLIVWGVMVPWEIMLCSWVFRFAEQQCCDGLDNLQFLLSNSTFHDFKLCCGSTWIIFKSILKSWNNECIEYNVEHGHSIQKNILRVYIMKYSNLETMNASSISWSTVASSKLQAAWQH